MNKHYQFFTLLIITVALVGCQQVSEAYNDAKPVVSDAANSAIDHTTSAVNGIVDTVVTTQPVAKTTSTYVVSGTKIVQISTSNTAFSKATITLREGLPQNAIIQKDISQCIEGGKVVLQHVALAANVVNGKYYTGGIETSCVLANSTISINKALGSGFNGGNVVPVCSSQKLFKDGNTTTATAYDSTQSTWCDFNSATMFAPTSLYESTVTFAK